MPSVEEKSSETAGPEEDAGAVGAGRGLIFISAAKLWFMVAGYAIQFALPRSLGSPAKYGAWGVVLACVSIFNNVMVTASIQSVSRFIAQIPARAGAVVRVALRRNLVGGGIAAALFIGGAPLVARHLLSDPNYTDYLRVAGVVTGCYALYAVFVGAANGLRQFHKQAGLDMMFATLRAGLVIVVAQQTHSVLASLGGFAAASVIILVVAVLWVGMGRAGAEKFEGGELERYFGKVAAYLVLVNLLMFIDGILLKRFSTLAAAHAGIVDAATAGDTLAGLYNAVQTIARLPYQLILAVTFVIFPLVSRATFDADAERARRYVIVTMRYSLLVVALIAIELAARPAAVMRLLFPAEYAVAAPALPILLLGYLSFSLFNILGTILNSAGDTRASIRTGVATVILCAASVWGVLAYAPAGVDPLVAVATATTVSMSVGMLLSAIAVQQRFGAVIDLATPLRLLVAVIAAAIVGRLWPTTGFLGGKVGTLCSLGVMGVAYLAIVAPMLRPSELRRLRAETRG